MSENGQLFLVVDIAGWWVCANLLNACDMDWPCGCNYGGAMDISRPDIKKKKVRRQWVLAGCGVVVLALAAFFVTRLKPAAVNIGLR